MFPRPRNNARRPDLQDEIKDIAWKQIAESGAATLSLRAVARELKIAAPSIYTYYRSRDDLVTALIVDAYNSLADALSASLGSLPVEQFSEWLFALGNSQFGFIASVLWCFSEAKLPKNTTNFFPFVSFSSK